MLCCVAVGRVRRRRHSGSTLGMISAAASQVLSGVVPGMSGMAISLGDQGVSAGPDGHGVLCHAWGECVAQQVLYKRRVAEECLCLHTTS